MPFILVPNEETNYYATLALSRPLILHWAGDTSYRYQEAMFLLNSRCLFCRVPFIITYISICIVCMYTYIIIIFIIKVELY